MTPDEKTNPEQQEDKTKDGENPPVILPKTAFPMRAGLAKLEPRILERWQSINLWQQLRKASANKERFILHDGPPYANGKIHLGTGLNKVIKDLINRTQQKLGKNAHYVPGWDCHGLPIEWKVEEQYRSRGIDKQNIPIKEFRHECRQFAKYWLEVQKKEFQRLGVGANWDEPYLTMTFEAEAKIAEELVSLIKKGVIYRSLRPVLWSIVEGTALAEAEVEYENIVSPAIYVAFPTDVQALEGEANEFHARLAHDQIVIWTTTPWTIPSNRMIAFGQSLVYVRLQVKESSDPKTRPIDQVYLIAEALIESFVKECHITNYTIIERFTGDKLTGLFARHPFEDLHQGYRKRIPLAAGDFVGEDQGTGFVHVAPAHGSEDFALGQKFGIPCEITVDDDGLYTEVIPIFNGLAIYDKNGHPGEANDAVIEALTSCGRLLVKRDFRHDYPHSWRSKTPLIFRITQQWFVALDDKEQIRNKSLQELKDVTFYPKTGYQRLSSMVELRPDWCISRQRSWGVPLPLFVHKRSGNILIDDAVFQRIIKAFHEEGADAWFERPGQDFLDKDYDSDDYEQVFDVVDVWFDSGSTHAFVLEGNKALSWPADLYIEGSDQHRGWFQSSLLQAIATRGKPPYKAVMTHGFVVDAKGQKFSKSLGNFTSAEQTIKQYGADLIRLWVASTDITEDIRFSETILSQQRDTYRRLRNSLRWMLGVLQDQQAPSLPDSSELDDLEQFILHRLSIVVETCCQHAQEHKYNLYTRVLFDFCNEDLSAFYFDIRKDCFYCDPHDAKKRQSAVAVIGILFDHLCRLLAPILCFTTEEAWITLHGEEENQSIHLETYAEAPWKNPELAERISPFLEMRRSALQGLDHARKSGLIRSSLEAKLMITHDGSVAFSNDQLAELCIVSSCESIVRQGKTSKHPRFAIEIVKAEGEKCQRCWKVLQEVLENHHLCNRCRAIAQM